jgi:hypothetical protein
MRFSIHDRVIRRSSTTVFNIGDVPSSSLSTYYLANSGVFAKSASAIINRFDIDAVVFANLFPPFLVSKTVPKIFYPSWI